MRKFLSMLVVLVSMFSIDPLSHASDRGQQLYRTCAPCHGQNGEGNVSVKAPALAGLSQAYLKTQVKNFQDGIRGAHPSDEAGLKMRPMSRALIHEADLAAVAAYISLLPKVSPDPSLEGGRAADGQNLYNTCLACHGPKGEGNEALKAPDLAHQNDWYLAEQLTKFRSGIRGTDPRDTGGAQMKPMADMLADEQAIKDVIAYIQGLR